MNNVTLIGRLTKDPEVRYSNDMAIASFTLAVERRTKEKAADYIRCKAFGKTAEVVEKWLAKGKQIAITGSIQTGSYEKDGQKVFTTDVVCNAIEFLDSRTEKTEKTEQMAIPEGFSQIDEAIPF